MNPGEKADPRLELILGEALRGLTQQQVAVESLRARAGTLIFAASFASSLLGGRALADGIGTLDLVALVLLLGIGVACVILLWPYYDFRFRLDPGELLDRYVDGPAPTGPDDMRRDLALRIESDRRSNGPLVRRMREALQIGLVLLIAEILAWFGAIATSG
jgi:hypothetical protein